MVMNHKACSEYSRYSDRVVLEQGRVLFWLHIARTQ